MNRFFFGSCLALACLAASPVLADVIVTTAPAPVVAPTTCTVISTNMGYGRKDAYAGAGEVSVLQRFLIDGSYLFDTPITGFYGNLTMGAVQRFQRDHGIEMTGYVGPLTRASIQSTSCQSVQSPVPTGTVTVDAGKTPHITSLSPNRGEVGTMVTVKGKDFDANNNTVIFGNTAVNGVSATGTMSFRVPQTNQGVGKYQVYVINQYGRSSNVLTYTLAAKSNSSKPSVREVIGPSTVRPNTASVWTLVVRDEDGQSVNVRTAWGDEGTSGGSAAGKSYIVGDEDQYMTFSHTYAAEGAYSITFRVMDDDSGVEVTKTVKVKVSASYQADTSKVSISRMVPKEARAGEQVLVIGSGFTPANNTIYFGTGAVRNVGSYNQGTLMYFTIPYTYNPCEVISYGACSAAPIDVVGGTSYSVYVENALGKKSGTTSYKVGKEE